MTSHTDPEIWLPVPSQPLLMASSWGRIMSIPYVSNGRTYQVQPTYGYWQKPFKHFNYRRKAIVFRRKTFLLAPLICEAFHGPKPSPEMVAMHGDEDTGNNRPGNIAWGTKHQNSNAPGFIAGCRDRMKARHERKRNERMDR